MEHLREQIQNLLIKFTKSFQIGRMCQHAQSFIWKAGVSHTVCQTQMKSSNHSIGQQNKCNKLPEYWGFLSYLQLHRLISLKIILVGTIKHRNWTANSVDSVFLYTNINWERWSEIHWVNSQFVLMTIRIWLKHDHLLKYMNYEFQNKTKSLPTEGNCENRCLCCKNVQFDAIIRIIKTKIHGSFLPVGKYNMVHFTKTNKVWHVKKTKQTYTTVAVINSSSYIPNFTCSSHNLNKVSKY